MAFGASTIAGFGGRQVSLGAIDPLEFTLPGRALVWPNAWPSFSTQAAVKGAFETCEGVAGFVDGTAESGAGISMAIGCSEIGRGS